MKKRFIDFLKTIASILMCPFVIILFIYDGITDIGANLFDDILKYIKK